jgi:AcrR family transcriptional regulator
MKRDAVLQTAVRLFNEKGFHATSLDDVALALNVTKPTIYHYFASKDEILFACVKLGLSMIEDAVMSVNETSDSALDRLKALMRTYAEVMTMDFGRCVIRTGDHELTLESRAELRALKRKIDGVLRNIIKEGIADGSILARDARVASFTVAGALNWIARWHDPSGSQPISRLSEEMIQILVGGLAAPKSIVTTLENRRIKSGKKRRSNS